MILPQVYDWTPIKKSVENPSDTKALSESFNTIITIFQKIEKRMVYIEEKLNRLESKIK